MFEVTTVGIQLYTVHYYNEVIKKEAVVCNKFYFSFSFFFCFCLFSFFLRRTLVSVTVSCSMFISCILIALSLVRLAQLVSLPSTLTQAPISVYAPSPQSETSSDLCISLFFFSPHLFLFLFASVDFNPLLCLHR